MEVRWCMVKKILILLFVFSSIFSYGQANRFAGFGSRNTCPVEALAFIDSAAITNQTEKDAVCTLIKSLKDSSLYSKYIAIYPLLGSTGSSAKWNAANIMDADSSHRLTFFGGVTFGSLGVTFNGTNGYSDSHIVPASHFVKTDMSVVALISGGTLTGGFGSEYPCTIGCGVEGFKTTAYEFLVRTSDIFFVTNGESQNYAYASNSSTTGIFIGNVKSGTISIIRNGTTLGSITQSAGGAIPSSQSIYIGANGYAGAAFPTTYQNVTLGLVMIGTGLTSAEVAKLNGIVNTYKTTLGR